MYARPAKCSVGTSILDSCFTADSYSGRCLNCTEEERYNNTWYDISYLKLGSFQSSEHINEKSDKSYLGFGYLSFVRDPSALTTLSLNLQYAKN